MNCPTPNESLLDRVLRVILAETSLILGLFWLSGLWQILAYAIAAAAFFAAISGFCWLYRVFGWDTRKASWKPNTKLLLSVGAVAFLAIAIAGSYYSNFFTRKFFLEDFNRMNNHYKQTLFTTGQGQREASVENYGGLIAEYSAFKKKYSSYRPYSLRGDKMFATDLNEVDALINSQKEAIASGDLQLSHLEFEKVRNIFQELLKRNGFSMLAVYLVDFHDSMEKVIAAADAKDAAAVIEAYKEADAKLKEVESAANDAEIKAIRANLEAVLNLAQSGKADEMSGKAAELKSSFVKVYLKRG
ncbi:MAG: DUF2892 domain-containing protein [Patescibacteria group bacterium]|nr:DUF2892 domain-containing protein [Patescibacteria group bacterium]